MSIEFLTPAIMIDRLARSNRHEDLAKVIAKEQCAQEDFNFGFQAACENGAVEAAQLLLPLAGIISVSRGMRKAAAAQNLACVELACGRLAAENAFDDFDIAIALRDIDFSSRAGQACAAEIRKFASQECWGWALRDKIKSKRWADAERLLEAGAPLEISGSWHMEDEPTTAMEMWRTQSEARLASEARRQAARAAAGGQADKKIGSALTMSRTDSMALADELKRTSLERAIKRVLAGHPLPAAEQQTPAPTRKRL